MAHAVLTVKSIACGGYSPSTLLVVNVQHYKPKMYKGLAIDNKTELEDL